MVPQFVTNVVGPTIVAQTFLPLVEKSARKTIVNVSSGLASIGSSWGDRWSSYSITKTAVNMLVCHTPVLSYKRLTDNRMCRIQTYKQVVERPDLTIIALNPGWAKTGMSNSPTLGHVLILFLVELGTPEAFLEVDESVTGVLNVLGSLKHEDSGAYLNYDGARIPW